MHESVIPASGGASVPLRPVDQAGLAALEGRTMRIATAQNFKAKPGEILPLFDDQGQLEMVLFGAGEPMSARALPARLPAADYSLEPGGPEINPSLFALAFALGSYRFDRYRPRPDGPRVRLVAPAGADIKGSLEIAAACALARDMVNTPAQDMGPLQIETIAREIAESAGAELGVISGEALLEQNYPLVHAVGRAAAPHRAPRMIEIGWRLDRADAPMVVLVGKGVVFDSGGLNIKPGSGMRWMKKDMGGAAHALALARLIMKADLPVRLVVLTPAVENAISGDAFRPGDVFTSRAGLTVEIGNTDAEGRLILADALARAGELKPDLTLDFATLTGAARVALGPDLPPFYTRDDALAAELEAHAKSQADPIWRMPLWSGYGDSIDSEIADVRNDSAEWAQAGSVTAALFLERFAPASGSWAHFDIFAWNPRARPGFPMGGEAQAIRAAFAMLKTRFSR